MKKIFVLTGKRGGYGAMKPMLKLFEKSRKFQLRLIVTDQHLDNKFGSTINEIHKDFKNLIKIPLNQEKDTSCSRVQAMSQITKRMGEIFEKSKPHYLILYGDRSEVLAAALAAIHFDIIIVHIQGGDVTGNIDDVIRNSVSKLSHIHLVSNANSKSNLIQMGEKKERIFIVGDNHIDPIINKNFPDKKFIKKKFNLQKKLVIFLFHPETLNKSKKYSEIREILVFLLSLDINLIAIYPCSDPGYEKIIKILKEFREKKNFQLFKNLESQEFLGLMNVASLLVGNSSCGIIEAPYFSLRAINLGERQNNRLRSNNITDLKYDITTFKKAVLKILTQKKENFKKLYGNGRTSEKIFSVIDKVDKQYKKFLKKS